MVRSGLFLAFGTATFLLAGPMHSGKADPVAEESGFQTQLAVQEVMVRAQQHMAANDPAKAVQALEEQVRHANGSAKYLGLLRDAYRAHIRNLLGLQQNQAAEKYRKRLAIIDSNADSDPSLRSSGQLKKLALVSGKLPAAPADSKDNGGLVARGKIDDVDPFALANQLTAEPSARQKEARALLAQAESAYASVPPQFNQARLYYEKAYLLEPSVVADGMQRWAYCKLNYVTDQLKQGSADAKQLEYLRQEAQTAVTMAPLLKDQAQRLLSKIDTLARAPGSSAKGSGPGYDIWPTRANAEGWQVTETTHFKIIHKQPRELVEKVAHIAEKTRYDMYQKWFGNANVEWNPKCDVYLHATGQDYTRATGQSQGSPGHARIDRDGSPGRVVGRRLELRLDNPNMLTAVLPHETTHVVLAGQFGPHHVPRWADEGVAVLTEPTDKIDLHRKNLHRCQHQLFKVKDLMNLPDYPESRKVSAFYAQSVVLVDFLTREKGPQVFTAFLRDGLKDGYEPALKKHYGWDFNALQDQWGRHMTAEFTRLSAPVAGR